jgi:hypothetical protein
MVLTICQVYEEQVDNKERYLFQEIIFKSAYAYNVTQQSTVILYSNKRYSKYLKLRFE